jgi:hypothetical protein
VGRGGRGGGPGSAACSQAQKALVSVLSARTSRPFLHDSFTLSKQTKLYTRNQFNNWTFTQTLVPRRHIQCVSKVALQLRHARTVPSFHNLAKMTTKDACTSSKTAQTLVTIETSASASTPVSQVGGLVEQRRYHGHLVPPILLRWSFSCGVSSNTECACHPYLQMSQSSEFESPPPLQK